MSWLVMDINNLEYESETFECVLEKGTIDALLVDEKSPWHMSEENETKLDNILQKVISKFNITLSFILNITFLRQKNQDKLIFNIFQTQ